MIPTWENSFNLTQNKMQSKLHSDTFTYVINKIPKS